MENQYLIAQDNSAVCTAYSVFQPPFHNIYRFILPTNRKAPGAPTTSQQDSLEIYSSVTPVYFFFQSTCSSFLSHFFNWISAQPCYTHSTPYL